MTVFNQDINPPKFQMQMCEPVEKDDNGIMHQLSAQL